jgi:site-specific recombinase XerD
MLKYLSKKETSKLMDGLDDDGKFFIRNKAIMILMLNTGVRVGELVGLNIEDVVNKKGELRDTLRIRKEISKNKKERYIPLSKAAQEAIVNIIEFNDKMDFVTELNCPLLISRKQCRITTRQIQRIIQDARNQSDIDVQATPHTLRHTFAKEINNIGKIQDVQKILGHTYITSTQIYTESSPEELSNVIKRLNFKFKKSKKHLK